MEKIIEFLETTKRLLRISDMSRSDCDAIELLLKQALKRFQEQRKYKGWGITKKVRCITTDQVFNSISDAAYYHSCHNSDISQSITLGTKVKKKYVFEYLKSEEEQLDEQQRKAKV